jgi:hypothetical protein
MRLYPDHLVGISRRLDADNGIFPFSCDDHAPAYQLHCSCGREELEVWKSEMPTVYARCAECHGILIAYDLRLYPAATYLERPDPFTRTVLACGCDKLQIYAAYEYPEPEEDVPFDANDISWCHIRCGCRLHQTIEEIVDDETA